MRTLHEPIVAAARDAVANISGNVLDLGCGNAALVTRVCEGRSDLIPFGIDSNEVALEHARQLLPHLAENFVMGDIFDTELWDAGMRRYALALLMPGRLLEVPEESALRLLDRLRSSCARILLYAYPDWDKHRLGTIARQFGLELEESGSATIACLKR
jgi:trans-aconitate methyltransferase